MQELQFDYFWNIEAEQFSFYRVPKLLFTAEYFKGLSCEAKVLYGLMLDRMGLSYKNRWLDEDGRIYIVFTVDDVMELLNCGKQKAIKILAELDSEKGIGLIEKRRLGLGKPNVIFVKNFMQKELVSGSIQEKPVFSQKCRNQALENKEIELQEISKSNFKKYENQTSGSMEIELQEVRKPNLQKYENQTSGISKIKLAEVRKSNPINTDINDTEKNETISSYLSLYTGQIGKYSMDRMDACRRIVRQNISYDVLVHDGIYGVSELDEIVELIVDVMMLPDEMSVRIGGSEKMAAVIKNRFMRLTMMHITYVLDCLRNNTSKVGNIKAYVLTSLYNATMTIDHYYQAEVGYDLHGVG